MSTDKVSNGSSSNKVTPASVEPSSELEARGAWGGQLEFILTMVGYAVGLGNVWRFPFLVFRNGGATFLIPYLLMLVLIGIPIFYHEVSFGQFAGLGPVTLWRATPIWRGVGFAMVSVSWILCLYYNVVIAYSIYFFFASMASTLPWNDCLNSWNDCRCIVSSQLKFLLQNTTESNDQLNGTIQNCTELTTYKDFQSPSDQFFFNEVLKLSPGMDQPGTIVWELALSLLLSWTIIFFVLLRGVQSLGKVMYVVTVFPYVMLTILLINSLTLDGAFKGLEFYMTPDIERLSDGAVWADAATQIFYSLSACSGGLMAMASYNKFNNNCFRDSLLVPIINCTTSIYAGLVIFATLGFMSEQKGLPIEDVAQEGPGLVFVVYPEAISQMPVPQLWAILFFIMMIFLGFSSEFSIVETIFVTIMDEFPEILRKNKTRPIIFRAVCICIFYLITLPMLTEGGFYLFNLVDGFLSGFPLLLIGMLELVAMQWVYGFKRYGDDVKLMLGKKPNIWFTLCWVFISPVGLLAVIGFKSATYTDPSLPGYEYDDWALAIGWMVVIFTQFWIPVIAIKEVYVQYKTSSSLIEAIKAAAAPSDNWAPQDPDYHIGRYAKEKEIVQVYTVNTQKQGDQQTYDNQAFSSNL